MKISTILSILGITILILVFPFVAPKMLGHEHSESGKYTIKGMEKNCDCILSSYGGSETNLICTDTLGHVTEITVRNHLVIPK